MSEERIHNPKGKNEGYEAGDKEATEFCYMSKGLYVLRQQDHKADATISGLLAEIKVELGYVRATYNSKDAVKHIIHLKSIDSDIELSLKPSRNIYLERGTGNDKGALENYIAARDPKAIIRDCADGGPYKALNDGCKILIHVFPLDIVPGGEFLICDDIPRLVEWLDRCMSKGTWKESYIPNRVDGRDFWAVGWAVPTHILIDEGLFKIAYLPE